MLPIPEKRVEDFEKLAFGIFIHWGLYSQLGRGEWAQFCEKIPGEEYRKLQKTFTAGDFCAYEYAALAKAAGAKYITFTTRHHEGFSLYDTKGLSTYDAPHSPAGRDLVREFVDACHEGGIEPILYHTTLDWYNEYFETDFPKYQQYLRDSVEILCTNYGRIGGLWFDGNWSKRDADWEEDALYALIRKHQPDAVIINNTGIGNEGKTGHPQIDCVTFEQSKADKMNRNGIKKYLAAETCQTMNAHWGWAKNDFNRKSIAELIETLCHSRSAGANYCLNIGPLPQGGIRAIDKAALEEIGAWIKCCGQSIYNGKVLNVSCEGRDFVLESDGSLYFYVYDLIINGHENVTVNKSGKGEGWRAINGLRHKIKKISWLDNNEELKFEQEQNNFKFFTTGYPYGINTVVRVAKAELE